MNIFSKIRNLVVLSHSQKSGAGFTLIEILIYVTILAVIVVLATSAIISVFHAFLRMRVERSLAENGDIALERMVRDIRSAANVDTTVSVFGSSPGILKVGTSKFYLSGAALELDDGVNPPSDLTSDVVVTSLIYYKSTNTNSSLITILLTLQSGTGNYTQTKNFYASAVLRGAY